MQSVFHSMEGIHIFFYCYCRLSVNSIARSLFTVRVNVVVHTWSWMQHTQCVVRGIAPSHSSITETFEQDAATECRRMAGCVYDRHNAYNIHPSIENYIICQSEVIVLSVASWRCVPMWVSTSSGDEKRCELAASEYHWAANQNHFIRFGWRVG